MHVIVNKFYFSKRPHALKVTDRSSTGGLEQRANKKKKRKTFVWCIIDVRKLNSLVWRTSRREVEITQNQIALL